MDKSCDEGRYFPDGMTDDQQQHEDSEKAGSEESQPVWARPQAFAVADAGWGWVSRKGRRHPCESFDELSKAIVRDAGAQVDLVWTPACDYLVLPEELPELHQAMRDARIRWAEWEMDEGHRQMVIFGVVLMGMAAYSKFSGKPLMAFGPAGLALLLFIVLGVIPWYQGRKRLRRARTRPLVVSADDLAEIRFETWLMHQKTPVTKVLLGLIAMVALCQLASGGWNASVMDAGLTKVNGRASDWWRLLTAPFLHGGWIHLLMNGSALYYLGRRMEVLARWPHVAAVFLLAAWVGGEASARYVTSSSVGASGGLMGLLGFLLVFENLHRSLVPQAATRRLLAGVVLTGVIGVIGFKLIDNAAHVGGLLAGMVYAFAVFPKSNSTRRPRETGVDRLLGGAALLVLGLSAGWACLKLM
ncbi:rhomboid family intramembrane serine protease [Haloferula chungangensis]|uniref:Rhomboid family intramembrane serine protease n=1 Tax=Haloferula chungangensis TaxID=1048331 RepID=A0ABW2LE33_9BACT